MKLFRALILGVTGDFVNLGIAMGFTFGLLLLLRPVTNRLLRPRYRVTLWIVGWLAGWTGTFYETLGAITVLPVTFRSWITPRTGSRDIPAYLPELEHAGAYTVELPGDISIPFTVTEGMLNVLAAVCLLGFAAIVWWSIRQEKRLKALSRRGDPMDAAWLERYGVEDSGIEVRFLDGLPASFVCRVGVGRHNICLQKELPEEQMELVLRHELAHIKQHHVWAKGIMAAMLCFFWWNPICWAAYRLSCRDIELACDEMVLSGLDEKQRRTYARTLVELASGKHLWGALTCFGECDAEIRVRRTVDWKRESPGTSTLIWPALALLALFLFTGAKETTVDRDLVKMNYILDDEMVEDLRRLSQEPDLQLQELWMRDDTLLILDTDGEWHLSSVAWSRSQAGYYVNSHRKIDEPTKSQFVQIKLK